MNASELRGRLVAVALEWHDFYGNAPAITGALGERDAATLLLGMTEEEYAATAKGRAVVAKGFDFEHEGNKYQIKAARPSGRPGSVITWVKKPANYDWDFLIWIRYDKEYVIQEAWKWPRDRFRSEFESKQRLHPKDLVGGIRLK